MRVVVTGSAGRVGRAICHELHRAGHALVGVDRYPASTAVHHVGDVADRDLLARACAGADAVIHVAALHAPHVGIVPDHEFDRVNVDGTRAVLDVAREHGIRRIVFTSSTAVYGRTGWIDEDTAPAPRTIYHHTKLAAERLLRDAMDLDVAILRMSRCFPEPADMMGVYRLHRGIDPRDVATAHVRALTHPRGGTWIVSGATPFQRGDIERLTADARTVLRARVPDLVDAYAARGWSLPTSIDRVYDATAASRELGWTPRYGYAEILAMADAASVEVLPPRPFGTQD